MKFVHIADMHFDAPFTTLNSKGDFGKIRRLDQREVFKKIIEYIKQNEIEYLFISGDFYEHEFIRKSTIEYINELFKTIPETLIFITPTRWNLLSGDLKIFMDRLNPLYTTKKLENKKMVSLVIGSKDKVEYSTEAALTSLNSFADSSNMRLIYSHQFNNCLEGTDILDKQEEIDNVVCELIKIIK